MDIEMFVCFHDGTWDTMWVKIPSEGLGYGAKIDPGPKRRPWDEEATKHLSRDQVMDEFGAMGIAFFGILPEFEPEEEEEEEEEEDGEDETEENEDFDDVYGEEDTEEEISLIWIIVMVLIIVMVIYATHGALQ